MITIINSSSPMDLPEHNVVAILIEETTNQTESQQSKIIVLARGESQSTLGKTSQSRSVLSDII